MVTRFLPAGSGTFNVALESSAVVFSFFRFGIVEDDEVSSTLTFGAGGAGDLDLDWDTGLASFLASPSLSSLIFGFGSSCAAFSFGLDLLHSRRPDFFFSARAGAGAGGLEEVVVVDGFSSLTFVTVGAFAVDFDHFQPK